jgi:type IV secretion system protein VirB9
MKILTCNSKKLMTMKTFITSFISLSLLSSNPVYASDADTPVAIDSRIKTFVYSENEIFPVVLHYGYQTAIEFGKDETIQTYSVGNQFVWQFSAVGRTLFIRPLEDNIVTNMTVLTNKRRYYFELYSKLVSNVNDEEMSYVVRFFYPDNSKDNIKTTPKLMVEDKTTDEFETIKPYNFNYNISGVTNSEISVVFDNELNTFFKFETSDINKVTNISCDGKKIPTRILGNYLVINKVCEKSQISFNEKRANINKIK